MSLHSSLSYFGILTRDRPSVTLTLKVSKYLRIGVVIKMNELYIGL